MDSGNRRKNEIVLEICNIVLVTRHETFYIEVSDDGPLHFGRAAVIRVYVCKKLYIEKYLPYNLVTKI